MIVCHVCMGFVCVCVCVSGHTNVSLLPPCCDKTETDGPLFWSTDVRYTLELINARHPASASPSSSSVPLPYTALGPNRLETWGNQALREEVRAYHRRSKQQPQQQQQGQKPSRQQEEQQGQLPSRQQEAQPQQQEQPPPPPTLPLLRRRPRCLCQATPVMAVVTVNRVQSVYATPVYGSSSSSSLQQGAATAAAAAREAAGAAFRSKEGDGGSSSFPSSSSVVTDYSPEGMEALGRAGYRFDLSRFRAVGGHAFPSVHVGAVFLERVGAEGGGDCEGVEGEGPSSSSSLSVAKEGKGTQGEDGGLPSSSSSPVAKEEELPPLITVLVPARNAAAFLTEALRSVLAQQGPFR